MDRVLVICGPTATGKTKLALLLAKKLNGELISADSRQVYLGNDVETGKDKELIEESNIKIWLLDLFDNNHDFSVSEWRRLAIDAVKDILGRKKIPIVIGGSGLYIKALVENLPDVDIPQNNELRKSNKSVSELFNYLKSIDSQKAESLNNSDKNNPRRLIRAIEIAQFPSLGSREGLGVSYVQIGLTASKDELIKRIKVRVKQRGLDTLFEQREINIMKKQLVWFKKQANITWFDIARVNSNDIIRVCQEKLRSPIVP